MKNKIHVPQMGVNRYNYQNITECNLIRTSDEKVLEWEPKTIVILSPNFMPISDKQLKKYRVWISDIRKVHKRGTPSFYYKVSFTILNSYNMS